METVKIEIEVPKDVLLATRISERRASVEFEKELALYLFEKRNLSFGKACQLAKMSKWDFLEELGKRRVPLHYGFDEYKEDKGMIEKG